MNRKEIFKSSLRILKRNKLRTFFMSLGIIISIASLVLTITLGKSFQKQITDRAKVYLGSNSVVIMAQRMKLEGRPMESDLVSSLTIADLKSVAEQVSSITMFDPVQYVNNCEVIAGNHSISTNVKGSSVTGEFVWNRGAVKGVYFNQNDETSAARVALIGTDIASTLFGNSDPVGETIRINGVAFVIRGVLASKGVDPHGNNLDLDIVIPVTTLMKRLTNVDYIRLGKLVLRDDADMDEAVAAISAVLRERHNTGNGSEDDFMVITPDFVKQKISEMTRIFNVFLPLISLIALLASCIVIVVLMLISVNERVAEIGLRKATGARYRDILFQFTSEATLTSLLGGITGIIVGLAGFALVSVKMKVPFEPSLLLFAGGFLLPVFAGIISGIIPARKAAKYNPVEALR